MSSFQISVTPHRKAAAQLVGTVRRRLQKAYADSPDVSQTDIAAELGVHRSVVNRQLRGLKDISLARVGEIACLLGYDVFFDLVEKSAPDVRCNTPDERSTFKVVTGATSIPSNGKFQVSENV